MINVTKCFLPPKEEYERVLQKAWDLGWLTNRGVLVVELERRLKEYLKVPHILAMTNGTLPIQIAIKALNLTGEIITTPFSYVATTSSIVWEGCTPVFVDIHPEYLTIDEAKIEDSITERTSAILATHVFGNPCAVEIISEIAAKYSLKVIYDAAHCFGVTYKDSSILNHGDASTISFHATKLFHTGEGGAIFTKDEELNRSLFNLHNFGHKGKEEFHGLGINAKMSELQGAMGLAVLPYIDENIEKRKAIVNLYRELLPSLSSFKLREHTRWNYAYFPIIFDSEQQVEKIIEELGKQKIVPRRYFYPSLDTLPYIENVHCPLSRDIASRILCLPLYESLKEEDIKAICAIVQECL